MSCIDLSRVCAVWLDKGGLIFPAIIAVVFRYSAYSYRCQARLCTTSQHKKEGCLNVDHVKKTAAAACMDMLVIVKSQSNLQAGVVGAADASLIAENGSTYDVRNAC